MPRKRSAAEHRAIHAKGRRSTVKRRRAPLKSKVTRINGYELRSTKGKNDQALYFFARPGSDSGRPAKLPKHLEVHVNKRTGLPYVSAKSPRQDRHLQNMTSC